MIKEYLTPKACPKLRDIPKADKMLKEMFRRSKKWGVSLLHFLDRTTHG